MEKTLADYTVDHRRLSPVQAAEYLGDGKSPSVKTLEKWRCVGGGPRFIRVGSRIMYDSRDLDAWLDERKFANTAEAV